MFDTARNGVFRWEIAAVHLLDACKSQNEEKCAELIDLIKEGRRSDFFWEEYPYGLDDEKIGYSGTVPSSFILLSLVEGYRFRPSEELLRFIVETGDAFYGIENDGFIRKAGINKGDVLNTNLIAAKALKEVSKILPVGSVRRRLYIEASRRAVRKALGYQSLSGHFPYHFDTFRSPILYQAMVTAQMRYFAKEYSDGVLTLAWHKGLNALKRYYQDGEILWDLANHHDKKGAIWAYSFTLASLEKEDRIYEAVERKMNVLQKQRTDPFFDAWVSFGLYWKSEEKVADVRLADHLKFAFLKIEFLGRLTTFCIRYIKNKIVNFPFDSGAMENRRWK